MTPITLGVHVHTQPERLRETLAAIERNTVPDHDLVLLPDGPDDEIRRELTPLVGLRQLPGEGVLGPAACLNRLVRSTEAGIVVLVESGAVVGPGWLDHLVAALDSSPRAGLAGPSTNRAWNEQGVFPQAGGSLNEVARTAVEAERRFGVARRTLAPLYSLGDFCYAVRREVFAAIGDADEGYGLGPCWEMDFNARAARAGFDGLWAGAAYVWRAPLTPRRAREEAARFEMSKRRYQDKLCGARLRGTKHDYRDHCRGDACPNFAPRQPPVATIPERPSEPPTAPVIVPMIGQSEAPLVSCIMPTYDRRAFIPEALRCFFAQDYPSLELIVVDDGSDPISDLLPDDPRIRYFRPTGRLTVGAKRNYACEQARGEIIAHWDDDDWYPFWRLRVQVAALLEQGAAICGSSILYFLDRARDEAFVYRYSGGGSAWVAGTTLVYRREHWRRNRFTDIQIGEDAQFVWRNSGAGIADLKDPRLSVAAVHAGNISQKETRGVYWSRESVERVREIMAEGSAKSPPEPRPLVSCVMPTFNRRAFIPLALACFRSQSYGSRELVVVDDGDPAIGDLLRDEPAVRYIHVGKKVSIGAKRNRGCAEARGEIVALWDDDDWYGPDRLERQVAPILRGEADLTGLASDVILELPQRRCWTVSASLHRTMFAGDVAGGTLAFRRSVWTGGVRFPEISVGEDAVFLQQASGRGGRLLRIENDGLFVYVRHGSNTWRFDPGTFLIPSGWSESAPRFDFSPDWLAAYAAAAEARL